MKMIELLNVCVILRENEDDFGEPKRNWSEQGEENWVKEPGMKIGWIPNQNQKLNAIERLILFVILIEMASQIWNVIFCVFSPSLCVPSFLN
jgi:hypothetical protein